MKKTVAALVAATLLSLGAAFAQETKPAAPATTEKAAATEKAPAAEKAPAKKHVKKHKKAAKKAEAKSEAAAPATGTEAPKK